MESGIQIYMSDILAKIQILSTKEDMDDLKILVEEYLKMCFKDLILRMDSEPEYATDKPAISKHIFSGFMDMPQFVSNKLFEIFNKGEDRLTLGFSDFKEGLVKLYLGQPEELIKLSFLFYSSSDLTMNQKKVLFLLKLFDSELNFGINLEELVQDFFLEKEKLFFNNYSAIVKTHNSSLLILFLIYFYAKAIFNEEEIRFYKENRAIVRAGKSSVEKERTEIKIENSIKIKKPEEKIYALLKANFSSFLSAPMRRYATKNVFDLTTMQSKLSQIINMVRFSNCSSPDKSSKTTPYNDSLGDICSNIANTSSPEKTSNRNSISSVEETYTEFIMSKFSSKRKLRKCKLRLINNKLFSYKYSHTKNKFILQRVHCLSGLYIAQCMESVVDDTKYFAFAFVPQYGSTLTNIDNIYFCEKEETLNQIVREIRGVMKIYEFCDYYDLHRELGRGQYAQVYLGSDKRTGEKVAVKVINKSELKTSKEESMIKNEIEVMKFLKYVNNPHIVKLIDLFEDKKRVYIVMEYMEGGSLHGYMKKYKRGLDNREIDNFIRQILKAMQALNDNGIIHRDLKPENILIQNKIISNGQLLPREELVFKISDFGFAKMIGLEGVTDEGYGTLIYTAPEILLSFAYNNKVDVWSFGILLYFLISLSFPFKHEHLTLKEISLNILNDDFSFYPESFNYTNRNIRNMMKMCLKKNPSYRASINELCRYFNSKA